MVWTISVGILGIDADRECVYVGELLKSAHLPSITGMPAWSDVAITPEQQVPSVMTATRFHGGSA